MPSPLTLIGGATGRFCGYVDFIAWDLESVLCMAEELFNDSDIPAIINMLSHYKCCSEKELSAGYTDDSYRNMIAEKNLFHYCSKSSPDTRILEPRSSEDSPV